MKYYKYIILLIILSTIIYCFPNFLLKNIIGYNNWSMYSETGVIGDTYGGLSAPLIGLINIVLLFITLRKQDEFNKRQNEFNKRQNEFNMRQEGFNQYQISNQKEEQFKSILFQLIQRQHLMYNEIEGTFLSRFMKGYLDNSKQRVVSGIYYFKVAKKELKAVFDVLENNDLNDENLTNLIKDRYKITNKDIEEYKNKENKEKMKYGYKCFIDKHYELINCHRHLYHILKYMKDEEDSLIELFKENNVKVNIIKSKYKQFADLFQATLTDEELLFAYYNCVCFSKTEELISHFQFVENLPKDFLFDTKRDIINNIKIKDKF